MRSRGLLANGNLDLAVHYLYNLRAQLPALVLL